jgi:hypothetical protein
MPENDDPDEHWIPIVKCDEYDLTYLAYEASTKGHIRDAKTKAHLLIHLDYVGYERVYLTYAKKKVRMFMVHRVIATAFNPYEADIEKDVDHIDSIPTNNAIENLQWLTRKDHAVKTFGMAVVKLDNFGAILDQFATIVDAARDADKTPAWFGKRYLKRSSFDGTEGYYLASEITHLQPTNPANVETIADPSTPETSVSSESTAAPDRKIVASDDELPESTLSNTNDESTNVAAKILHDGLPVPLKKKANATTVKATKALPAKSSTSSKKAPAKTLKTKT